MENWTLAELILFWTFIPAAGIFVWTMLILFLFWWWNEVFDEIWCDMRSRRRDN